MRVYLVRFDGDERVVEAKNFGDAIEVWRDGMKEDWGKDWRPDDEPNSVELLSDDPVIRDCSVPVFDRLPTVPGECVKVMKDARRFINDAVSAISGMGATTDMLDCLDGAIRLAEGGVA